ncbi:thioredoxin family protein [Halpernia frigidisoli]|uniref:Thioredoxin-like domain-containing protein n=1 Tax=Halpernia frigidisoli TaxID=1125876 RepID=A0A1I3D3G7_9FLAO|nr:thioredoxin fold domain-containing protein [Halpernia frigidisoli]SFH81252.1 Thioredoxin-like domain-containing protein [Halpernia frigidisoli]
MKKIINLLLLVNSFFLKSQVKWMTFADAIAAQKVQPKKIIIDFYAEWCKPCKEMDARTYGNSEISNYINENFYPVKFEADGNATVSYLGKDFGKKDGKSKKEALNEFTRFMNVSTIPSTVFLDENSNPVTNLNGFLTAKELEPYLHMIATDDYKKIKSRSDWETYTSKLRSKIRE